MKLLKGKRWKSVVCASKFPRAAGLVLAGEREPPVGVKRVARGPFRRASVRVSSAGGRTAGGSLFLPRQVHAPGCSRLSAGLRPRNVGNTRPFGGASRPWLRFAVGLPKCIAAAGRGHWAERPPACSRSWRNGFHRPVLKHGPRSLTYMRVFGWQTLMRNESEGQRWLAEV